MPISSIKGLIAFAVKQEENASQLYRQLKLRAPDQRSRKLLGELAEEETEHGRLFARIGAESSRLSAFAAPAGKLVSEFLTDIPLHDGMSFSEVMMYAIKKEEKACRFYRHLAASARDPQLAALLEGLADAEQTHKVRLEECFLVEVSDAI